MGYQFLSNLQMVIQVAKKYLSTMSKSYSDPKLTVKISDGIEHLKKCCKEYDVIITDASDEVGQC